MDNSYKSLIPSPDMESFARYLLLGDVYTCMFSNEGSTHFRRSDLVLMPIEARV